MKTQEEKSDERKAAAITLGFHAIVVALMFFLVAFSVQDPAPGDMYVEIGMADYGFDEKAGGSDESENPSPSVQENQDTQTSSQTKPVTAPTVDKVTQETSTVSVPKGTKTDKPSDKPTEEQKPSSQLSNILGQINNKGGGGSDGSQTGTGNEGNPDGKIEGKGVIGSDGIGFDLGGRGMSTRPVVTGAPDENGLVVVDVMVDSNGNVIGTPTVNDNLSTTTSGKLRKMALDAAKTAKFEAKPGATTQKGKIYFNFKVK